MAHKAASGWACAEPECRNTGGTGPCRYPTGDFQVLMLESELDALIAEKVKEAKRIGWDEGYDACREGKQRHSPYKNY